MGKPLVICETRSLAEDVSRALGGRFISEPTHLEGSDLVLTWMDGPLAGLADPEVYDAAPATWRIEDLPVAPERFEVVARAEGEPAKEQLKAIRALGGGVTLGRVLTPMLAELVRRERAIEAFEPVASDVVDAAFEPGSGSSRYRGRWIQGNAAGSEEVADQLQGARGQIWRIRTRTERRRALLLYELTALQRDALRLHGLTAQRVEDAAQECFEQAASSAIRAARAAPCPGSWQTSCARSRCTSGGPQRPTASPPGSCRRSTSCRSSAWSTT